MKPLFLSLSLSPAAVPHDQHDLHAFETYSLAGKERKSETGTRAYLFQGVNPLFSTDYRLFAREMHYPIEMCDSPLRLIDYCKIKCYLDQETMSSSEILR